MAFEIEVKTGILEKQKDYINTLEGKTVSGLDIITECND